MDGQAVCDPGFGCQQLPDQLLLSSGLPGPGTSYVYVTPLQGPQGTIGMTNKDNPSQHEKNLESKASTQGSG